MTRAGGRGTPWCESRERGRSRRSVCSERVPPPVAVLLWLCAWLRGGEGTTGHRLLEVELSKLGSLSLPRACVRVPVVRDVAPRAPAVIRPCESAVRAEADTRIFECTSVSLEPLESYLEARA